MNLRIKDTLYRHCTFYKKKTIRVFNLGGTSNYTTHTKLRRTSIIMKILRF